MSGLKLNLRMSKRTAANLSWSAVLRSWWAQLKATTPTTPTSGVCCDAFSIYSNFGDFGNFLSLSLSLWHCFLEHLNFYGHPSEPQAVGLPCGLVPGRWKRFWWRNRWCSNLHPRQAGWIWRFWGAVRCFCYASEGSCLFWWFAVNVMVKRISISVIYSLNVSSS